MIKRLVVLLVLSSAWTGCGSKPEPAAPASQIAAPPAKPTDTPAPAAPAGSQPVAVEQNPDLAALNAAYRKYWSEKKSPPGRLEDLVAAKYLPSLPVPPKGKRFSVDWSKMEVTLVNQ